MGLIHLEDEMFKLQIAFVRELVVVGIYMAVALAFAGFSHDTSWGQ